MEYRCALAGRLRERSDALAEAIFERIWTLEGGPELQPPRTLGGLRPVIQSLVEYGAVAVELGERKCPPPPPAALEHARKAAWTKGSASDLHRAYLAARTVFNDFLSQEAHSTKGYGDDALAQVQRSNDVVFEHLFHCVGEEFEQELERKRCSPATWRLERVNALLAGELLEAPELDYEFDATHIGIVGSGKGLDACIKDAARSVGGRLLLVQPSPQKLWAWIGTRSSVSSTQVSDALAEACPPRAHASLGDPAAGVTGWRRTYQEALVALPVAIRREQAVVRFADVLLIAVILDNDLLRAALERIYLLPLGKEKDGGDTLRRTLRAYFAAGRNGKSAAAELGVTAQTVTNRIRRVEARLGRTIRSCGLELEAALRIADLFQPAQSRNA